MDYLQSSLRSRNSSSMTYIRRLEMRGFKSSGPKSVAINFERGLTVITGPNGSGKSNIADAILFAIGENSPKQLRAANGRLSGLIYDPKKEGDTPSVERPNSCRVTIQFDNADRSLPVDSDTVTITRELRDNGENIYYINGKRTTRASLIEILDIAGISPGSLNIVPQGSATKVADLTPEEKRRMIEDVVGISKFDEKKAEAQRQLSQADQRLEVAMARIGEMRSTLELLELQRNELVRFNILESQINWLRAVKVSGKIIELKEKVSSLRANEQSLQRRLVELDSRAKEIDKRIADIEGERNRFIVEVIQGGGASHVELQFQLAEVDNELKTLESELSEAEANISSLENETIPSLKQIVASKEREVKQSENLLKQLSSELQSLDARYNEVIGKINEIISAEQTIRDTIERKGKQVSRASEKLSELNGKLNEVQLSINSIEASLGAESKRLNDLKVRVEGYAQVLSRLEENTKKLFQLQEDSASELKRIEESISQIESEREEIIKSIDDALEVLERANSEISKEKAFRDFSKNLASERVGQARLQELCENGGVPGYIGRLNQLIKYPQAYSRAVLAILGRWLGSFIVRDLRSMVTLIKAGKSVKAKAFSVIPLEEVKGSKSISVTRSAGVIGVISNIVKCDEEIKGVLNFLAGDVVLVESQALAYLLATDGLRAVTLSGEIFEPGGRAFSFGYQEMILNFLEGLEDIEDIGDIEEAVHKLKRAIEKRKAQLSAIELDSRALMKERIKKIASIASLRAEASTISRITRRYRSIFRAMDREYQRQKKVVERLKRRLELNTRRKESLSNAIKAISNLIENFRSLNLDGMLQELQVARQELSSEADQLRNRIAELNLSYTREKANLENVLLRALEENRLDLESAIEEYESEKEFVREAPKRIKELNESRIELQEKIERVKESSRKSQPVLDDFENKIRRLKEERESLSRTISGVEKELFAVRTQIDSVNERIEEAMGSLRILGYNNLLEPFDNCDYLLSELEREYEQVLSSLNRAADRQYREMYTNYKGLSIRYNELEKERNSIISFIESIESEKRKVFISAFEKINTEFRSIFKRLADGDAWLELEEPDDIFSGGVLLMARFGNKPAWESLSLSGGEKAVTGVALILAMQSVQGYPFYLFDEIDSALDAVNSSNLAQFLRDKSREAQIIVITLRDVFIAKSDVTYGLYSAGGISRLVHYRPAAGVPIAK